MLFNCSLVILGTIFVYVQWHYITIATCVYFIMIPSYYLGPAYIFNIAVNTGQCLLKCIEFMPYWVNSVFLSTILDFLLAPHHSQLWLFCCNHTSLKWPILLHSVHVFPYAKHCLRGWLLPHICMSVLQASLAMCVLELSLCMFFTICSLSNSPSPQWGCSWCGLGSLHFDPLDTGHTFL